MQFVYSETSIDILKIIHNFAFKNCIFDVINNKMTMNMQQSETKSQEQQNQQKSQDESQNLKTLSERVNLLEHKLKKQKRLQMLIWLDLMK